MPNNSDETAAHPSSAVAGNLYRVQGVSWRYTDDPGALIGIGCFVMPPERVASRCGFQAPAAVACDIVR